MCTKTADIERFLLHQQGVGVPGPPDGSVFFLLSCVTRDPLPVRTCRGCWAHLSQPGSDRHPRCSDGPPVPGTSVPAVPREGTRSVGAGQTRPGRWRGVVGQYGSRPEHRGRKPPTLERSTPCPSHSAISRPARSSSPSSRCWRWRSRLRLRGYAPPGRRRLLPDPDRRRGRRRRAVRGPRRPPEPADRKSRRHRTFVLAGWADDRLRPRRPHLHRSSRRLRRAPPDQRPGPRLAAADLTERSHRPLRAAHRRGRTGRPLHRLDQRRPRQGPHPGPGKEGEARFAPDGKTIVFVRISPAAGNRANADLCSIRPSGTGLARLTSTGRVDEFDPRYFAGGIVFSRGNLSEGPAGYADIYTMKADGTKVKPLVEGVGSAYVEDVSPQGHTLIFRRDRGLWMKKIGPARRRRSPNCPTARRPTRSSPPTAPASRR